MDTRMIEKAAILFFEMCRQHPEICPHEYSWIWSSAPDPTTNTREAHYKCGVCGHEIVRTERV